MATTQRDKLNKLYTHLAPGTPLTSEDLSGLGISADLAVHYVRAGWLERLARGVYRRPNDPPALHPSIALLQRQFEGLHVGGKSALDWHGIRQYVSPRPVLHLYGWKAGHRDQRSAFAILERPDVQQRVGALIEQPLTMVFGRKAVSDPVREGPGLPAVEMKDGAWGHVLADAVPVERRFATDMQPLELSLQ